jgi:hypothetical protein
MKARFNRAPLYLTITLLAALAGGCGESGGNNSTDMNVKPSPQPVGSQPFPKPTVPDTTKSATKVALTRPTNPDDRLRVIKSGRNDPFQGFGNTKGSGGGNGQPDTGGNASPSPEAKTSESQYYKKASDSYGKFLDKIASVYTKPSQTGTPSSSDPSSVSSLGGVSLPSLPSKPELASVKVTGVMEIAGVPHAIVQAPDEPTSRTVGIGDALSGGRLVVRNIDLSNPAEPQVIFQQGDMSFSVAVGREPVLIASAVPEMPTKPVRGFYPVQVK